MAKGDGFSRRLDRLKFLPTEEIELALSVSSEVGKMLNGLMNNVGAGTR